MRRFLLTLALITTINLSSSNVLPILSIKKLNTEPLLDDQGNDNTFNKKHIHINPNIFYKVFIETPKDNLPKKALITRLKFMENDNQDTKVLNGKAENDDKYDDKGFRKEQWHNYPRQLDRLNRNYNVHKESDNILLDTIDLDRLKGTDNVQAQYISNDLETLDADAIDQPLLILKIRLAYLNNNINNADSNKFKYMNLIPVEQNSYDETTNFGDRSFLNKDNIASITKVKRKAKPRLQDILFLENSNDKKSVRKRIFSLWSRLQSLSHRGHELHHRRHLYALYGLPEDGGGALTAETRATMIRPPGSPLRWG